MTRKLSLIVLPAAGALLLAGAVATPVAALDLDCTWAGAGVDANWSTAGNWTGCAGGAPGDGDRLLFPAGAAQLANTNDLFGTVFAEVRWDGDGYVVGGDPVETHDFAVEGATTVNADLIVHQAGADPALHLSAPLTVGAGHVFSVHQGAGDTATLDLEGAGVLDAALGGSDETLRVIGDGTLVTRGNTYAGTIELQGASRLSCGGADCGPSTGTLTIDDSAALEFTGDTVFPRPIVLGASGAPVSGVGIASGGFDVVLDGLLTVAADAAIQGGGGTPLALAGGASLGSSELGIAGAVLLPTFAQLASSADGALHVGGAFGAAALEIRDGQPNHLGATSVMGSDARLVAGDDLALGPNGSAPTSVSGGATLGLDGTFALAEQVHLDAASRIATETPGSSVTVNDLVLHDGGRVETVGVLPSAISLAGVSGTGPLHLVSGGTDAPILFDAGGSSTYAGLTVAESGTIALNRDTSVTGDLHIVDAHVTTVHTNTDDLHDAIPDTATVTIDGGDLVVNDNERIGALAGAGGAILVPSAGSGLTVAGASETTWAGNLRGHGALTHEGEGSLRLDGDWLDAADGSRMFVENGFVAVHGSMPETDATVQGRFGGTGALRSIELDGGTLAPGDLAPGCIDAVTSIGGAGVMEFELGGLGDCESDRVIAAVQHLSQADWQFSFVNGFVPELGDVFTLVTTSGPGSDDIPTQDFTVDGVALRLSADSERIILTVVGVDGDSGNGGGSDDGDDGRAPRGDLARTGGSAPLVGIVAGLAALLAGGAILGARRRWARA